MNYYTLLILGMAAVTVFIKAAIFILGDRVVFPRLLKEALGFVPVTVLTAIIVPMVLSPHGAGLEITWRNPQLIGAIVAIVVCALTRHQLLTIGVALAVFFGWQFGVLG
jgi:branched-subunit amino acid transport protein